MEKIELSRKAAFKLCPELKIELDSLKREIERKDLEIEGLKMYVDFQKEMIDDYLIKMATDEIEESDDELDEFIEKHRSDEIDTMAS